MGRVHPHVPKAGPGCGATNQNFLVFSLVFLMVLSINQLCARARYLVPSPTSGPSDLCSRPYQSTRVSYSRLYHDYQYQVPACRKL